MNTSGVDCIWGKGSTFEGVTTAHSAGDTFMMGTASFLAGDVSNQTGISSGTRISASNMQAFYREARASASLNHTNIIHIYSFDEYEGQPYLVMELANCGSVDGRIEKEQRMPEIDVLDVGIKMASALDAALKHNLLHRDIKPGNILYNADGEPKLIDFGLACGAEDQQGGSGEDFVWGTPYYVAPEKIERKGETFLSDMCG